MPGNVHCRLPFCTPCLMHDRLAQYAHQYRGVEFPQPGDFHADPPVTAFTKGIFECLTQRISPGNAGRRQCFPPACRGCRRCWRQNFHLYRITGRAAPYFLCTAGKGGAVGPGKSPASLQVLPDLFPLSVASRGLIMFPPHVVPCRKVPWSRKPLLCSA